MLEIIIKTIAVLIPIAWFVVGVESVIILIVYDMKYTEISFRSHFRGSNRKKLLLMAISGFYGYIRLCFCIDTGTKKFDDSVRCGGFIELL